MGKGKNKSKQVKHKQKLSALDLRSVCRCLESKLKGKRLTNVYDINNRNYLFKFGNGEEKELIHIEIGNRIHSFIGDLEKKVVPSGLTMKLRKKLKSKRLERIEPIGVERVIRLTFGSGEVETNLFLEFYSKGNMILTDKDLVAICVTRSYKYNEEERVGVGAKYPVHRAASLSEDDLVFTEESVLETLKKTTEKYQGKEPRAADLYFSVLRSCHMGMINPILRQFDVKPNKPLDLEQKDNFLQALKFGQRLFMNPMLGSGYLIRTKTKDDDEDTSGVQNLTEEEKIKKLTDKTVVPYFDFSPILFKEYQENENYIVEEFEDFDEGLSIYFDNLVRGNYIEKEDHEAKIWKKFENIKKDQEGRLKKIAEKKNASFQKAQLIEANIKEIEAIIEIITSLMHLGMTCIIKSVISQARKQGDVLASIIHDIDLAKSKVAILLGDEDNLEEELEIVDIDLNMGAYENAQSYYKQRSQLIDKEKKTKQAANEALKTAEDAAKSKISKHKKAVKVIKTNRKTYWFEKFYWFISSENYLVISARDAQQNEAIIKKYLAKDDIVFHTQVQGSAFTIVKNPYNTEVPVPTLEEAALATLCHSRSWDNKVINDVYWVFAHQVSKTAPTGLSIGVGSFMIYGKKNFIRPRRLQLGFGLLFKLDEESKENHKGERRRKDRQEFDGKMEAVSMKKTEDLAMVISKDDDIEVSQVNLALPRFGQKKARNMMMYGTANQKAKAKKAKEEKKKAEGFVKKQKNFDDLSTLTQNKKKKRLKKMMKKYGDMDEEDREMRMQLIGAKKIQGMDDIMEQKLSDKPMSKKERRKLELKMKRKARKEKMKQKKEEEMLKGKAQEKKVEEEKEVEEEVEEAEEVIENEDGDSTKANVDEGQEEEANDVDSTKANQEEPEDNQTNNQEEEGEKSEKQTQEKEQDDDSISIMPSLIPKEKESELNQVLKFDDLTGMPKPEDQILEAIPICAPIETIKNYKYKVKIVPGNMKKGKATKFALNLFEKVEGATHLERGLIKGIPDGMAIQQMLGNVKFQGGGVQKLKNKQKNKKKEKKKNKKQ